MARWKTVPFDDAEAEGKVAAVQDDGITNAVRQVAARLSLARTA